MDTEKQKQRRRNDARLTGSRRQQWTWLPVLTLEDNMEWKESGSLHITSASLSPLFTNLHPWSDSQLYVEGKQKIFWTWVPSWTILYKRVEDQNFDVKDKVPQAGASTIYWMHEGVVHGTEARKLIGYSRVQWALPYFSILTPGCGDEQQSLWMQNLLSPLIHKWEWKHPQQHPLVHKMESHVVNNVHCQIKTTSYIPHLVHCSTLRIPCGKRYKGTYRPIFLH